MKPAFWDEQTWREWQQEIRDHRKTVKAEGVDGDEPTSLEPSPG